MNIDKLQRGELVADTDNRPWTFLGLNAMSCVVLASAVGSQRVRFVSKREFVRTYLANVVW